jgi:hypothetical protein
MVSMAANGPIVRGFRSGRGDRLRAIKIRGK